MLSCLLLFYFTSIILFHLPLFKLIKNKDFTFDILFFIISNIILITFILNMFLISNTLFYLKKLLFFNKSFFFYLLPYLITNFIFLIYPFLK